MGVNNGDPVYDMAVGKKSNIGEVAQKKSQKKHTYTDISFHFHLYRFRATKVINNFELF